MTEPPVLPGDPSEAWASSAKDVVLTALGSSRVWVTIAGGIPTEMFWPSSGRPQIRRLGFLVCRGATWTELGRGNAYRVSCPDAGVHLPAIVHAGPGFRLGLRVLSDPRRDVALVSYRLFGRGLRLFAVLEPRLDGRRDSTLWIEEGLMACRAGAALCLAADRPFRLASVGCIGEPNTLEALLRDASLAASGPISEEAAVLMAEVEPDRGTLALGFAGTQEGARVLARSSLGTGCATLRAGYESTWKEWAASLRVPDVAPDLQWRVRRSAAVIKTHEDRTFPGAVVASLSIPWGGFQGDLRGGYHVVWTRDAVEAAFACMVLGQLDQAKIILAFLVATQDADGHWWQSYFPDGRPFWRGIQLDEAGFPVLLAAKLSAAGALDGLNGVAAMAHHALRCIARVGPASPMDRWEDSAGVSPFSLAVEIAALVAGSRFLEPDAAAEALALALADYWNERQEDWTFVERGGLSSGGYYVRVAPVPARGGPYGSVRRAAADAAPFSAEAQVGLGFAYLARLGLRAARDPRLQSTMGVVDRLLRVATPRGVAYHRYNGDRYGEHADGQPFDGAGVGRAWPLLTGERGHFALLAGEDAAPYLHAMGTLSTSSGLLPEQVWDAPPIPSRGLRPGYPTGSATPLVWAHAEYIKLVAAQHSGKPAEMLDDVVRRYSTQPRPARAWHWRRTFPFHRLPAGRDLVIEDQKPFDLGIRFDDPGMPQLRASAESSLGLHCVGIPAGELAAVRAVHFDMHEHGRVQATTHSIHIGA
ncbi:glycoside hydrolase family 15 protein [Azospirillum sp. sgz301742]